MVDVNFGVDVRARIRSIPLPRGKPDTRALRHSTSKLCAGWVKRFTANEKSLELSCISQKALHRAAKERRVL